MFKKVVMGFVLFGLVLLGTTDKAFADAAADFEKADILRKVGEREECEAVYKSIIENYPNTDNALKALEEIAGLNISIGSKFKTTEQARLDAEAAIERLTTDFAGSPLLPTALCNIAAAYGWATKFQDANDLYRQVIENCPDSSIVRKAELGIARIRVLSLIKSGNIQIAEEETSKLLEQFSGHPDLAVTLYSVAKRYRWCKEYQKAKNTFEQIVQQYPDSEYAEKAKVYAATAEIFQLMHTGDYTAVEQATDRLLADTDLADNPELPTALCRVAEVYADLAFRETDKGPDNRSEEYFDKSLRIWGRIIDASPTADVTPHAYYSSGICYLYMVQYEKAIEHFSKAVSDWPGYRKACYAQYQIAHCYEELAKRGDITNEVAAIQICQACEKLLAEFPDCRLSMSAQQLLKRWEKAEDNDTKGGI